MNWSNVTNSIIAQFILPNWTVTPKLDEYSVVDYGWSSLGVLLLQLYSLNIIITLIKTIINCQPFDACSLTQHSTVFLSGTHYSGWRSDLRRGSGEEQVLSFLKVPHGKEQKGTTIFIHRGCQWTYDGLTPYASIPTRPIPNKYRTTCLYVRGASSTTWGLTTQRPFL